MIASRLRLDGRYVYKRGDPVDLLITVDDQ